MINHPKSYWIAGDRIGLGDLIAAHIQLYAIPPLERGPQWHQQHQLISATLNHITEEVEHLPGTISLVPPRPPIQPTDKIGKKRGGCHEQP